jgi:cell division control protein 45
MDMDLKKQLHRKLEDIAPEYGMVELSYPSFMRCYGFRSHPLSASDAVEAVSALLDIAGGVKVEVEVEGARNGGEWFGGGRLWEILDKSRKEDRENIPPEEGRKKNGGVEDVEDEDEGREKEIDWWVKNFWNAFDALTE